MLCSPGGNPHAPKIPRISAEEPKEEKAYNSATLSPKREVVCLNLSAVKAQRKRKEQTPSPSSARITIDLTAEEEYASFPLTQLSEREPSTLRARYRVLPRDGSVRTTKL